MSTQSKVGTADGPQAGATDIWNAGSAKVAFLAVELQPWQMAAESKSPLYPLNPKCIAEKAYNLDISADAGVCSNVRRSRRRQIRAAADWQAGLHAEA